MRVFTYLMAIPLLVACGKPETTQKDSRSKVEATAATPATKLNISGQVFIVTKGRDNIKLALVEVAAIPESDLLASIKAKHASGIEQQKPLVPAYASAKKEADAATAAYSQVQRNTQQLTAKYNALPLSESGNEIAQAMYESSLKSIPIFESSRSKQAKLRQIASQIGYFDSGQYYFEKLPASTAVSKTDADGKFTFSLPPGKYVIAASTSRKVSNETEFYYWLVSTDPVAASQSLMLSNDNQFETKCKECIQPDKIQ